MVNNLMLTLVIGALAVYCMVLGEIVTNPLQQAADAVIVGLK